MDDDFRRDSVDLRREIRDDFHSRRSSWNNVGHPPKEKHQGRNAADLGLSHDILSALNRRGSHSSEWVLITRKEALYNLRASDQTAIFRNTRKGWEPLKTLNGVSTGEKIIVLRRRTISKRQNYGGTQTAGEQIAYDNTVRQVFFHRSLPANASLPPGYQARHISLREWEEIMATAVPKKPPTPKRAAAQAHGSDIGFADFMAPSSPGALQPTPPTAPHTAPESVNVEELGTPVSDTEWYSFQKASRRLLLWLGKIGVFVTGMTYTEEIPQREWREDDYVCRYNPDDFTLTLTDANGLSNQYSLYPNGEIWTRHGSILGTVSSDGDITRVAPQDDVDYRRWVADGGEPGFEQWKAQGRPKDNGAPMGDGANAPNSLKIEKFKAPKSGKVIGAAVDGNAAVPLDKVNIYSRGKVADVTEELRALQRFKQTDRKLFDADPSNAKLLDQLKAQKHNFDRSSDMARHLEGIGLSDTPANNQMIIEHLLQVGNKVTPENRLWVPSTLKGPNGNLQVESTWKILEDKRAYLTTLKLMPSK